MKPSFNPLALKVLGEKAFALGPKKATGNVTEFTRGVIDTMNIVSQATRISYRPQTVLEDVVLASEGGYNADRERALTDALLLADAALWRFDFLRPTADELGLTDSNAFIRDFNRSLEEALVLNSLAVNKHSFFIVLSNVLSLTDLTRQNLLVESILDILLLEQDGQLQRDFLRGVSDNLTITGAGTAAYQFMRALTSVIEFNQNATLNGDFVRDVSDLLLIVDDAQYLYAVLRSLTSLLEMNVGVIQNMDFGRSDARTLNLTQVAAASLVAGCGGIDWTLVGTTYWSSFVGCIQSNNSRTANYTESRYNAGGTAYGTASGKWRGAVLAPNGYVYGIPLNDNFFAKFDISGNTQSSVSANLSSYGASKWSSGVMAKSSDFIICAMWSATSMMTFNTANDTWVAGGSGFTGGTKWSAIVTNKDGYSFMIPYDATYILGVENANTSNTFNAVTGLTGSNKWSGACLYPDGTTIVMFPSDSTSIVKVDTSNSANVTTNTVNSGMTGTAKWIGGVLTDSEWIYSIAYTSTNMVKINTNNDAITTFGTFNGTAKYSGGVFAWNQRIYCIPYDTAITAVLRIDTQNSDYTDNGPGVTSDVVKYTGGVYAPDGTVIMTPGRMQRWSGLYIDAANTSPTQNVLLSPYWNRSF